MVWVKLQEEVEINIYNFFIYKNTLSLSREPEEISIKTIRLLDGYQQIVI